jgi:hypothetical protein
VTDLTGSLVRIRTDNAEGRAILPSTGNRYLGPHDATIYRVHKQQRLHPRGTDVFSLFEDTETGELYSVRLHTYRFEIVEDPNEITPNY